MNCLERLQKVSACSVSEEDSLLLYGDKDHYLFTPEESDYIVSVGGDGAVLRASRVAINADKPLIGVKAGRLGFLTAIHIDEAEILTEDYLSSIERQTCSLLSYECGGKKGMAVNDVVLGKSYFGETVELEVKVNGNFLGRWRCDGVIVSTPLGSTSYNISAGGPVILPEAKAIAITPICPHELGPLTYVTSEDSEICVEVIRETKEKPCLFVDGEDIGRVSSFKVTLSDKKLTLLKNSFVSETLTLLK